MDESRFQASHEDALGRGLSQIAALVRECCDPLLAGDPDAFSAVERAAATLRRKATLKYQYGAVRDKANEAWEAKNYEEAYRLYSRMEEALTEQEKRRLSFLEKRLGARE